MNWRLYLLYVIYTPRGIALTNNQLNQIMITEDIDNPDGFLHSALCHSEIKKYKQNIYIIRNKQLKKN